MIELLVVGAAAGAASLAGYFRSRKYVRERLRFVDKAHTPAAPVIAGALAALVAAPIVWLLPFVGAGTALLFGVGVGAGVAAGSKDSRRLPGL